MKRRDFIKNMPLAVVPFFSNRLFAEVMPITLDDYAYFNNIIGEDRVLVVVQMDGGNDGLNMVLPLDQYSNLAAARSNILIPDTSALLLGSNPTGLHPAMTGLKSLYDQNRLCVVQGVSYASPSLSHFRGGDIWASGSDANTVLDSGWLGRYLEYAFPNYPSAYPNPTMPDPLSIQIGSSLSRGLMGYSISTGQTVPSNFTGAITQLQSWANTSTPPTNAGNEVAFLRNQQAYANQYASSIINAWNGGTNIATYAASPSGISNNLGNQLKIVARLIKGGLKTKVYWVRAGGYDTHSSQVNSGSTTTGKHADLLKELSDAINNFMTDITAMGLENQVMGMTFSEFGRRIKSNGSSGTDHGVGGPMFIFGKDVNPAVVGANPIIPANVSSSAGVPIQFDFKQIYQGLLQGWFCVPAADTVGFLGPQLPTIVTNTTCLSVALPIEFLRFVAEKANQRDAHIEWVTATEQSVDRFEIQRSTDGKTFNTIATQKATGHAHDATRYDYLDVNLPIEKNQTFYYRLRVIEEDGNKTFTETVSLSFDKTSKGISADIFPNPIQNNILHLKLKGAYEQDSLTEITVMDSFGRRLLVHSESGYVAEQELEFSLEATASNGVYFLSITNASQTYTQRIVKL